MKKYYKILHKPTQIEMKMSGEEAEEARQKTGWDASVCTVTEVPAVTYRGYRTRSVGSLPVSKDGKMLDPKPSQRIWNHSPDGFNWGYGGSGPAQLALALLMDAIGDVEQAAIYHQDFKREFVATWGDTWQITDREILTWFVEKRKELVKD